MTIFQNYPFIASICSILFAQFVKFPILLSSPRKMVHVSLVTSTGGMPSSPCAVSSLPALIVNTDLLLHSRYQQRSKFNRYVRCHDRSSSKVVRTDSPTKIIRRTKYLQERIQH